jgi:hypothetical protein
VNRAPSVNNPGNGNNGDLAGTSAARDLQNLNELTSNQGLLDAAAEEIHGQRTIEWYDEGDTNSYT